MRNFMKLMTAVAVFSVTLGGQAMSQGTPQTLGLLKVDFKTVATGYRTSKVVGSAVFNESDQVVGKIDDLIVTPSETVPFAVLSVGGFLGVGSKYVVVPYSALEVRDKKILLRDATKENLKSLPEFKYSN
ncbi:PRC-barrel domain-containing protein [Magnetospirillum molischianum]|uniref:PRC-barrel domain-containing protein n=1 Tax=Magnetospirillum molischianum DSM 120 TaxID=1150626 RepID=H8FVL9_MAGML|nr:PRC-barrel domain-containing protein [Magnetospirillum molischianum]CCG42407.1 conserved exported hypothetical protein [Magnetospirillum molischianum DSM 120]